MRMSETMVRLHRRSAWLEGSKRTQEFHNESLETLSPRGAVQLKDYEGLY